MARSNQLRRDERGVTLIVVALVVTALLVMAGLVLDFGQARASRTSNKSAADRAVAAGMHGMAHPDGYPRPWAGICEAYNYVRANHSDVPTFGSEEWVAQDGTALPEPGSPCETSPNHNANLSSLRDLPCNPGDAVDSPYEYGLFEGTSSDGRIIVEIRSGYQMPDPEFDASGADAGSPAEQGCDNLAVIVRETEEVRFGEVVGTDPLSTKIRSVGRLNIKNVGAAVAALVLLEREGCMALNIQGNSGANVQILAASDKRPGIIQVDSLGNLSGGPGDCGTNRVLEVDPGSPSSPLIVSHAAKDGSGSVVAAGVISMYALSGAPGAVPANASDPWPSHVKAEANPNSSPPEGPTAGDLTTREPVDTYFLGEIRNVVPSPAPWLLPGADHTVFDCGMNVVADPTPGTDPITEDTKHFIDCPGGITYASSYTFEEQVEEIVFNGPVTVQSTGTVVRFENPRRLWIKGSSTGPAVSLSGDTDFLVNLPATVSDGSADNDGDGSPDPADNELCDDRSPTNQQAKRDETLQFVIGEGPFETSGQAAVRMCSTTLLMTDGSFPASIGAPPANNTYRGRISISGQGDVEWTAPNTTDSRVAPGDSAIADHLEDLAFWTETSAHVDPDCGPGKALNCIQGNGLLTLKGIFVLPNANPFRIAGNGGQEIGADAQFWTRRLQAGGKGTLKMKPNPNDAVPIRIIGGFELVR